MKNKFLILGTVLGLTLATHAQDIAQNQVPSVISNQFNSQYSKATDIEWEMDGNLYNVDFEIGWNTDHEIWYNKNGEIVKHKEDIAKSDLPETVKNKLKSNFKGYSIDDLEQITDNGKVLYKIELDALVQQDWDVVLDSNGNVISKIAD
jgi:uncharacterized membrane protein YkoI